ncbi:hypothetical protein [Streptomyces sp. NPDC050287]|uniref:hypothetical protein n=1 Tax=Streptomyces sp. NPDC050287 TaxID=3365608 RepID=UPI00379928D4
MRLHHEKDWDAPSRRTAAALAEQLEYWPLAIELACGHLAGREFGLREAGRCLEQIRGGPLPADAGHPRRPAHHATPFSILPKGTLILRDLDLEMVVVMPRAPREQRG